MRCCSTATTGASCGPLSVRSCVGRPSRCTSARPSGWTTCRWAAWATPTGRATGSRPRSRGDWSPSAPMSVTGRRSWTPPARPPPSPRIRVGSFRRTCREPRHRDEGHHGAVRRPVLDPPPGGWEPAPVTTRRPPPEAGPRAPPPAAPGLGDRPVVRPLKRDLFGWYSYDWAMSVFNTSVTTVFLGPYLTALAEDAAGSDDRLSFLGLSIAPGSWFSYVLSVSVVLQVLVLPLTGAVADRTGRKREMLDGFA